jgi:hypothetical protein
MVGLSVAEQDRKLRHLFPDFRLVLDGDWVGIWEGPLTPIAQTYVVRILYFRKWDFGEWQLGNSEISVTVVDPPLGTDPRGTGEPVPHVYRRQKRDFPALCLFDPRDPKPKRWSSSEFIVDKIIPWAIKWLWHYEWWLLTGEWRGGGRHPEEPKVDTCLIRGTQPKEDSSPGKLDHQEQSSNAAFHRLGQRIGVFASFPLMAAASVGSSPPLSWLDLSAPTPAETQSLLTSILSREHRLAA